MMWNIRYERSNENVCSILVYKFSPADQKGLAINGKRGVSVKSIKVRKLVKACRDSVLNELGDNIGDGLSVSANELTPSPYFSHCSFPA